LDLPILVTEWLSGFISLRHVLGVAMVGGEHENATHFLDGIEDDLQDRICSHRKHLIQNSEH
jgi:hypothetical protein